ncbi:MAG TPA: hypothetical protein VGN26_10815 [Armatimonadota bacterium]|jgi:hypothetical protein
MQEQTGETYLSHGAALAASLEEARLQRLKLQDEVDSTLLSLQLLGASGLVDMNEQKEALVRLLMDVRRIRHCLSEELMQLIGPEDGVAAAPSETA